MTDTIVETLALAEPLEGALDALVIERESVGQERAFGDVSQEHVRIGDRGHVALSVADRTRIGARALRADVQHASRIDRDE